MNSMTLLEVRNNFMPHFIAEFRKASIRQHGDCNMSDAEIAAIVGPMLDEGMSKAIADCVIKHARKT